MHYVLGETERNTRKMVCWLWTVRINITKNVVLTFRSRAGVETIFFFHLSCFSDYLLKNNWIFELDEVLLQKKKKERFYGFALRLRGWPLYDDGSRRGWIVAFRVKRDGLNVVSVLFSEEILGGGWRGGNRWNNGRLWMEWFVGTIKCDKLLSFWPGEWKPGREL